MNAHFAPSISRRVACLRLVLGLLVVLIAVPWLRAGDIVTSSTTADRTVVVDRTSHGSIRHVNTDVVRSVEVHHDDGIPRHGFHVHQDVETDLHFLYPWNDFAFGLRCDALPLGYLTLRVGATTYYYSGGIYYQLASGGYVEVYPPAGAVVPQPPDGAIEIADNGQTYYYAGGAFYIQQPDFTYAVAPTPIGVVVPELPPGAIQVSVNGTPAYQFNGTYYEPTFVNGVTQYETVKP